MPSGSWPYVPSQCPECFYFQALEAFVDDTGYEILGFCRHPRIAMELFRLKRKEGSSDRCPLFVRSAGTASETSGDG